MENSISFVYSNDDIGEDRLMHSKSDDNIEIMSSYLQLFSVIVLEMP